MFPSKMNSRSTTPTTDRSLSTPELPPAQFDGPIDSVSPDMPTRRRRGGDVCVVFVHAGAGYHSVQNEKVHLAACEE